VKLHFAKDVWTNGTGMHLLQSALYAVNNPDSSLSTDLHSKASMKSSLIVSIVKTVAKSVKTSHMTKLYCIKKSVNIRKPKQYL